MVALRLGHLLLTSLITIGVSGSFRQQHLYQKQHRNLDMERKRKTIILVGFF